MINKSISCHFLARMNILFIVMFYELWNDHIGILIMLTIASRMVRKSDHIIQFFFNMSFLWCMFLDSHPNIHHSYIGINLRTHIELNTLTLVIRVLLNHLPYSSNTYCCKMVKCFHTLVLFSYLQTINWIIVGLAHPQLVCWDSQQKKNQCLKHGSTH